MQRTIVPQGPFSSEEIASGVTLEQFYPGGLKGPNGEADFETMGGQNWTNVHTLGTEADTFQMMLPDIRMPPNQYWPLHWHDCWTVVLIVEGSCLIGDWVLEAGDVFLAEPSLEYGPLVSGPRGVRLFEIFAQAHLAAGGYAPEYHDHPTLQGSQKFFFERSSVNQRNNGRQTMPCDGVEGISRFSLEPGLVVDMGDPGDQNRGILRDVRLAAGDGIAAETVPDWRWMIVLAGQAGCAGRTLGKDAILRVAPGATTAPITAGPDGAQLLELARTAIALPQRN